MQLISKAVLARYGAGVAFVALMAGAAHAQGAKTDEDAQNQDIVVTGTLIRGIAPAGSNVLSVNKDAIKESGGATTSQVLGQIPQISNFFGAQNVGVAAVPSANGSNPIGRPNLRTLPGANTSGGAQTLVLLDGARVVGAGTQQIAVDPDIIAPGAIERVEAMLDGGSAVYGSDALGGVLNFITRRRFNGFEISPRVSLGDDYHGFDISTTLGKDWGSGGFYVAYSYATHDAVYGSDRDYVRRIDYNTGLPVVLNCAAPNATIGTKNYVVSGAGLTAGGPNRCDPSQNATIYPSAYQHNVFVRMNQDINDWLGFDITTIYANRLTRSANGPLGSDSNAVMLTSTNPSYRNTGDANSGLPESVRFDYSPAVGARSSTQETKFSTLSVAPSLTAKLGGGWEVRALASYGRSKVSYSNAAINPTAQAAAIANGTLNPFDVGAASPAVIDAILGRASQGYGKNELADYRVIADGPLLTLPAGDLHVAVGGEYMRDSFSRTQTDTQLVLQTPVRYSQTVQSLFGEVQLPIFSDLNEQPLLRKLLFSASARYDKYNDFGDTFNPKLALTYKPINWMTFKGNWGKSFNAPTPVDQLGPATAGASLVPGQYLQPPPGKTFGPGETGVYLGGGSAAQLQPQTAKSWSVGVTVEPPVVPGLRMEASYYHIDLNGTIGRPVSGTSLTSFYNNYPNLWIYRPTGQQLAAIVAGLQNPSNVSFTIANPTSTSQAIVNSGGGALPVGVVLDTLTRNLGRTKLGGIDFSVSYVRPTSFGAINASFAGTYRLQQDTQPSPTAAVYDDLASDQSTFRFIANLGAKIDQFRAQATLKHTSGYRRGDAGQPTAFGQERVSAFNIVDLFFKYDFNGEGVMRDLSATLNVQNVLNEKPPVYLSSSQPGYDLSTTFTLGRVFQLGFSKRF